MTPRECWEKHKHLDYLFEDSEWMATRTDWKLSMLYDCWQAVKQAATEEEVRWVKN